MSFEIPEPFKWDESFEVFYTQIDEEHRGLFDGIFEVAKAPGDAGTLASLVEKVKGHFSYEEGVMQSKKYIDFNTHKGLHDGFVSKMEGVSTPVSTEDLNFMKNWLVQHIMTTDFKYKGKLD